MNNFYSNKDILLPEKKTTAKGHHSLRFWVEFVENFVFKGIMSFT